jgi:hypothetical protein
LLLSEAMGKVSPKAQAQKVFAQYSKSTLNNLYFQQVEFGVWDGHVTVNLSSADHSGRAVSNTRDPSHSDHGCLSVFVLGSGLATG